MIQFPLAIWRGEKSEQNALARGMIEGEKRKT